MSNYSWLTEEAKATARNNHLVGAILHGIDSLYTPDTCRTISSFGPDALMHDISDNVKYWGSDEYMDYYLTYIYDGTFNSDGTDV